LFPFTEFGAVARTYPVACSGVRQRNFDLHIILPLLLPGITIDIWGDIAKSRILLIQSAGT